MGWSQPWCRVWGDAGTQLSVAVGSAGVYSLDRKMLGVCKRTTYH
jgi:hypothetical protein